MPEEEPFKRKLCSVYGCKRVPKRHGWCGRRYDRWRAYGSPTARVALRARPGEEKLPTGPARYGLTAADVDAMAAEQNGCCATCGAELVATGMKSRNIDHCHETGRVRGLLCRRCNWGMGILGDDPDLLEACVAYLRRHAEIAATLPAIDHGQRPAGVIAGCQKPKRIAEVSETVRQVLAQAKLTEDDVRDIRAAVAAGASKLDLAHQYGVSKTAIHSAVVRRTWAHVS